MTMTGGQNDEDGLVPPVCLSSQQLDRPEGHHYIELFHAMTPVADPVGRHCFDLAIEELDHG
ncbi:MAG: hypothetical protein FWF28_09595, partial [Micrococcales bacterium]|nr:hypothetical protein [Micrococcales bacterium]